MSTNPTAPAPKVLSQLLQNHRLATPVTGTTALSVITDSTGELQAFSIGSSGDVYWLYQDPNSDTGWSMNDLAFPGKAAFVAAVLNPDKTVSVVASSAGTPYIINFAATPGTTSFPWTALPATNVAAITMNVGGISAGNMPDGTSVIVVYNFTDTQFYMLSLSNGTYSWGEPLVTGPNSQNVTDWQFSPVYDDDDWSGPFPGVVWTGPMALAGPTEQSITSLGWWPSGSGSGCGLVGDFTIVSPVVDVQDVADTLALSTSDHGIYYLGVPIGSDGWQYTSTKISEDTACVTVASGRFTPPDSSSGPAFLVEAFALSTSGFLYLTRQLEDSSTPWDDFICLNDQLVFTQISASINGEGNSEVFAVMADGTVYHIWQDSATTDWNFDKVEYAVGGLLEDVPTYQTQIRVFDAAGMPAPNLPATLTPHDRDDVTLEINGEEVVLGQNSSWTGFTDALGGIVVNCATDALGTPALDLWFQGMLPTDTWLIDASGTVQATLSTVTGETLIAAGVISPQYESDADEVAQAVCAAMALADQPELDGAALHPQSDPRVIRFLPGGRGKHASLINLAAVGEHCWSFDMRTGRPKFRNLDRAEALALIAKAKTLPDYGSIFDVLTDTWGDITSAIESGAAQLVELVFDGAQAVLTVAIHGVQYFFQTAITLIEQTLDLVQQILTTVQVAFAQLFAWLGFIFNWPNILRTQEAMVYIVNEFFAFMIGAAATIQTNVDKRLVSFANEHIPPIFESVKKALGPDLTLGQYEASAPPPPQGFDSPAAQLMATHMVQNASGATPVSTGSTAKMASASSTLQTIIDTINNYSSTYGVDTHVQAAMNYFEAAANSPDQYLQFAVTGMLEVVEAAVLAAIAGLQAVVDAILSAISAIIAAIQAGLNQEWNIPVVSDLYSRMTQSDTNPNGLPLTALSLLGLLIAMPATVVYSVVKGVAPFPDNASLTEFKAGITAAKMLQNSGLGTATPPPQPLSTETLADSSTNGTNAAEICGILRATGLAITAEIEPLIDIQPPTGVTPSPSWTNWNAKWVLSAGAVSALSWSVLLLETADVALSAPWISGGKKSWNPNEAEAWACYGWVKDSVKWAADSVFLVTAGMLPRQWGEPGTYFEVIMGSIDPIVAFGYWWNGGNLKAPASVWCNTAGDFVGGIGDQMRILRLQKTVVASEGISLVVLAASDVVGNLLESVLVAATA